MAPSNMAPVAMAAEKVMGDDPIDAAILTRPADNRLRQTLIDFLIGASAKSAYRMREWIQADMTL